MIISSGSFWDASVWPMNEYKKISPESLYVKVSMTYSWGGGAQNRCSKTWKNMPCLSPSIIKQCSIDIISLACEFAA